MSDLLNSLHAAAPSENWAQTVTKAEESAQPEEKVTPTVTVDEPEAETELGLPETELGLEKTEQAAEEGDKVQRVVPLKALQEEREKRAALERRLAELEKWASSESQPETKAEEEPDPEIDPIGALKYERQKRVQIEQQRQQEYQIKRLETIYQDSARQFAATTPDFKDAYNHTIQSRARQLKALGYDDQSINTTIRNEEMGLVDRALQHNQNPAAVIYEYAKSYGYTTPTPVTQSAAKPDPVAVVEQQAKKANAATSMSTGGKAPKADLSMSEIANLSGAAFDSAWAKMAAVAKPKSSLFRN